MSTITGRVVDYNNDNPIANVLVQGINSAGAPFASTRSDSEGKYSISHEGFDNPYAKISFTVDGYATQTMRPASANNADVVLPPAGTLASFTLTLRQNKTKAFLFVLIGAVLVWLYLKHGKNLKL